MKPDILHFSIDYADVLNGDPWWKWDSDGLATKMFVLWLITGGKGTLSAGKDFYNLRPGDCIVSPLWQPHHGRHNPGDRLIIYWVRFSFVNNSGSVVVPDPVPRRYRRIGQLGFLRDCFKRVIASFNAKRTSEAHCWLNSMFIEIADVDKEESLRGAEREQYLAVQAISEKIREEPGKPWLLGELSGCCDLSRDHFIRVFNHFTGQTPRDFIIRTRLEAACNFLRFSSLSVSEISDELGFCDVHYFSRLFSARMGISPLAFRKKN
jgi:AraC-like DNA-binding protein